ncbi:MAB_1171c family putative transporter [Nocardia wallacei]|uniref:MAB_1171c family putative transporter n=1 Tax=Nocardia wallacei TaxID=480035 RepID=UPI002453C233|nr:MAB_1171c family putative transporter [Nocardia wallacei]
MTSPIPGWIAWPALAAVVVITAGRWWLLHDKIIDRLINRALLAGISGFLLREAWFEHLATKIVWFASDTDVVQLCRQLSFGSILLSVSAIYGIAKLWDGADPGSTWRRQRGYDLVAVVATVVILAAGTPARHAGQLIDQHMGWPAVIAWIAFYAPIGAAAMVVGRVSIRELRGEATWRERVLSLGVLGIALAIGLDSLATPILTAFEVMHDRPAQDPDMSRKGWIFFLATVSAGAVVAVPLVSTILTRTGWDRTGRYCRRLQPVWRDLTASVPEIVLEPLDDRGWVEPATRLHRMIIEIRDSLLHLRRYGGDPDIDPAESGGTLPYAVTVAKAIDAKNAGHVPAAPAHPTLQPIRLGARDLTSDLRQLLDLAKVWPHARRLAAADGIRRPYDIDRD